MKLWTIQIYPINSDFREHSGQKNDDQSSDFGISGV